MRFSNFLTIFKCKKFKFSEILKDFSGFSEIFLEFPEAFYNFQVKKFRFSAIFRNFSGFIEFSDVKSSDFVRFFEIFGDFLGIFGRFLQFSSEKFRFYEILWYF